MATKDVSQIQANLRQMMLHEAKPNPQPTSSVSVTRGFEKVAFPKIVRELQEDDQVIKQKSLMAARELLGSSINYVQCIAAGITPAVIKLLMDSDAVVRERAAGTVEYLAVKEVGARDLIQHSGIPALVTALEDPVEAVRDAAYKALVEAARFDCTRRALIEQGDALPLLMELVLEESHFRSLQGLLLLNACVKARHSDDAMQQLIVNAKAVPSLVELISEDRQPDIQEQSALLLGLLTSLFTDAKLEAVQAGAVPKLLALLRTNSISLACAVASALMSITIANEGKYAVIGESGGIVTLGTLLNPLREQLCVNITEVICNVAEAPESRETLLACGAAAKLKEIHDTTESDLIKRTTAHAMRRCQFHHRPFEPLPGHTVDESAVPV